MSTPPSNGHRQPDARLLVVEDEPNILELLAASLRYAGFEVVTAAAGSEAVQAAQRHRPDLIVLDVMLPDMDGFDVIRRLRGGGTRLGVAALVALAGLVVAALGLVPGLGYGEAVAAPLLALRLRGRGGKRYAGLRILAKD